MKKNARIEALKTRAKVSQFISPEDAPPGTRVIPCARVSTHTQEELEKLQRQKVNLSREVAARRWTAVTKLAGVEPAREAGRKGLLKLIRMARERKAAVLVESIDRLIRNPKGNEVDDWDIRRLVKISKGVSFILLNPPETPASKVRSYQTKRGQKYSGHYGGRPRIEQPKKTKRLALLPEVIHLHKQGWGYKRIGEKLGVATSTVQYWLR
jgi:DNA invertase Pin-like site-specific DNA recombinase